MNKDFIKDRQIEKETYAINNYFKLLKLVEVLDEKNETKDTFYFIGGMSLVNKLLDDYSNDNIDIFNNSIDDLYQKLKQNISYLKSTTMSNNFFNEEAIKDYKFIKNNYESIWNKYDNSTDEITKNVFFKKLMKYLPVELSIRIYDLGQESKNNDSSKVKKIGER